MNNRRFKIINSKGEFIKSPFETSALFNKSKEYKHKCSAKRFISNVRKLKIFACKDKPEACPYYEDCLKYRTEIALLNKCPIEQVISDVNNWTIAEYSFNLEKTEKVRGLLA